MNGVYRLLRLSGGLVVLTSLLVGCTSQLPMAEMPPPPVTVCQPLVRQIIDHDDYEGRIAARETVDVRARVRGHLVKVAFEDGQIVKEKDMLFEIDPRSYKASLDAAEAQKAAAEASLELARKEFARYNQLARTGAGSREELEVWTAKQGVALAERLKALANVEQAQLDLDFTKIVAPIAGKASRALVTTGNLVNGGASETLLTTITSIDPMYVYFDVDERSLLRYKKDNRKGKEDDAGKQLSIKEMKIPVYVALEGEEGFPHTGQLDFSDNRVNPSTGTIQVRGVLANTDQLLDAGLRARVRVPVSDPYKALMVTERAIGTDQGRKFVYVVNGQDIVERRDVKLDRLVDGMQIIKEGLKPDDWVIVNGIQRVRDGLKVVPRRTSLPGAKQPAEPAQNISKN